MFKESDAHTISSSGSVDPISVLDKTADLFACDDKDNLIPNGDFSNGTEFWGNFNGMGDCVEVATSENNKMLHFKGHWCSSPSSAPC